MVIFTDRGRSLILDALEKAIPPLAVMGLFVSKLTESSNKNEKEKEDSEKDDH